MALGPRALVLCPRCGGKIHASRIHAVQAIATSDMWQTVSSYNDLACQVYEGGVIPLALVAGL